MFEHEKFDKYAFENVPLNRDIYLMDEKWMSKYEASLLEVFAGNGADYEPVGYISYACARKIVPEGIELSWYPNIMIVFMRSQYGYPRTHMSLASGLGSVMRSRMCS